MIWFSRISLNPKLSLPFSFALFKGQVKSNEASLKHTLLQYIVVCQRGGVLIFQASVIHGLKGDVLFSTFMNICHTFASLFLTWPITFTHVYSCYKHFSQQTLILGQNMQSIHRNN